MTAAPTQPRTTRRAGQRRGDALHAACDVIAARGADGTRFSDVSVAAGVPVSTLQYYFGNREDLIIAAFRHEVLAEQAALAELLRERDADPWHQLVSLIRLGVVDSARSPTTWRIWVEFWRAALRDDQLRDEAHAAYRTWRSLVAGVVREGLARGRFRSDHAPDELAHLVVALIDGIGVPVALADPGLPDGPSTAATLIERAVSTLLGMNTASSEVTVPG